ncbi:MAG: tetratricopeptide repeat protein [Desulfatibacillum sp.]|nr:tetratricopeptide repeat protein [Desulfatibacillum sp.]
MDARKKKLLVCLMLLVLALAGFHALPQCDFTNLDDSNYVQNNSVMGHGISLHSIKWAFTTLHGSYWIPLTWLSLLLDAHLYGMNAGGYHLTNLLFHIANGFLLFLLLNRATRRLWLSALVAGLFMVHPIQVESVAWITERKDVLSVFFWMLTFHAYLAYVENPRRSTYLLMALLFTLGLMAKPMIVTLPCVMLLFDFWPLGRMEGSSTREKSRHFARLVWEKAPLFVLAAIFSVLTVITQGPNAMVGLESAPMQVRLGNMGATYLIYLKNIFWPSRLAIFYPAVPDGLGLLKAFSWGALGVISALVTIYRKHAYLFVGWFLFVGVLFPVSGILQSGLQGMADRFAYIPVIGVFILVVFGLGELTRRFPVAKIPAILAGVAALVVCPLLTAKQVSHWKNSITIMEHTLEVTENNWFAEQVLGSALYKENRLDEAIVHLKRSLQRHPDFPPTYNALGMIMAARGEYEKAVKLYLRAIGDGAKAYQYYNNLGVAFLKAGKEESALEAFKQAMEREPGSHQVHFNTGMVYQQMGDRRLAKLYYHKALELKPDLLDVYNNLGIMAIADGEFGTAMQCFQQTLQGDSQYSAAWFNLAKLWAAMNEFEKARSVLKKVVQHSPRDWEARILLAKTLIALGQNPQAKSQYEAVLTGDPNNVEATQGLEALLRLKGDK